MTWKTYTIHMLLTNLMMAVLIYLVLVFQDYLPFNPLHFAGMEPLLAFNTTISFITNTDWQAYAGETTLSNFSQMAAITFPMFTSAATGFVVAMAFIRAFGSGTSGADLGNFYRDLVRFTTRVLMPAAFMLAILLIQQGEPQTLDASVTAHTIQGTEQTIALGPVASLETIKHLGTNGGGFFNANAAHPYENPTAITNLVQTLLMIILPASIVLCFGHMIGNRRQGWILYAVMGALLLLFLPITIWAEQAGTTSLAQAGIETTATATQPGGNMEGKEVRFGIAQSGLFNTVTTSFTTGSVNGMLDSFTPLGAVTPFVGMMLQCIFGGKGVGFLAALVYGIVAVFVAGLMVGRTPEFLGKKIEKPEIVLVSLTLLIHPLVILTPTAWSVVAPYGLASIGNAGIHGYSEVLYAFATSAANNGSAFAGTQCGYALVQSGDRICDPDRPLPAHYLHDGGCRLGRGKADFACNDRNLADRHPAVCGFLVRDHPSRRRADIFACAHPRSGCGILRNEGAPAVLIRPVDQAQRSTTCKPSLKSHKALQRVRPHAKDEVTPRMGIGCGAKRWSPH